MVITEGKNKEVYMVLFYRLQQNVGIRVVNLGPVYTIPGSGFPGILDL